jgi:vesicle coat complex subunit
MIHPLIARGKVQELQAELQQADRKDKGFAKKKIALKKIVANMTMGNDSELVAEAVIERSRVNNYCLPRQQCLHSSTM